MTTQRKFGIMTRTIIVIGIIALCGFVPTQCIRNKNAGDYLLKFQKAFEKYAANLTEELLVATDIPKVGSDFICPSSVSPTVPKSVHLLRPGDIRVMGAVGDSLTTAYGAGASTYLPVMFEYPGLAASIGGDKSLDDVITLPNIFRKYNPHVYGFSTGLSVLYSNPSNKRLNEAISGSYAEDMPEQARKLITKMKADHSVDFDNDWKFITLFIGGNDLCSGCLDSESSPENYIRFIEKTIQIFHDESPRTFLNVLSTPVANQMVKARGPLVCDLMTSMLCPCLLGGSLPEHMMYLKSREFQRLIRTTVESGQYDDKDDFAAVYQPFMEDTLIPTLPDGSIDRSYFSPDCFHLSQKGQAAQATANWNNLFQPVGSKTNAYLNGEELNCPSTDFPYLYTNVNSQPGFRKRMQTPSTDNRIPMSRTKSNTTATAQDTMNHIPNTILRLLP